MTIVSWEQYTEKQRRAALRVLDSLDQLDSRLDAHYSGKRKHRRVPFRALGRLVFAEPGETAVDPETAPACQVWVRSLSQSGLSFISPFEITKASLVVGLDVSGCGATTWFVAEVVRSRKTPEGEFYEHGVKFLSRAAS